MSKSKPEGFGGRKAHTKGCWENRDKGREYTCYCPRFICPHSRPEDKGNA